MLYAAAVAWARGANPYSGTDCAQILEQQGGDEFTPSSKPQAFASLYPPTFFPLLSPLALLDWPTARVFWALLNTLATLSCIPLLLRLLERRGWLCALTITATVLAWGPIHTGIGAGQPAPILLWLVLAAVMCKNGWLSGLSLALAILIKPQVGLPFLVLYAWDRRWLAATTCLLVSLGVTAISVWRLQTFHPSWPDDLANNLAVLTDPAGGLGSPMPTNPLVYQLMNTAPLLHRLGVVDPWVGLVVWAIVIGAAGLALYFLARYPWPDRRLLLLSGLAALPLLPVYHRVYDATLLLIVAAWVYQRLAWRKRDPWAIGAGLCLLPLMVPGPAILAVLTNRGTIPDSVTTNWGWQTLVMQQHSWCALALALVLLGAARAGYRSRHSAVEQTGEHHTQ
ncbi:MAG: glycosyltransferase family 87 protein [Planctomycetota bacterium]